MHVFSYMGSSFEGHQHCGGLLFVEPGKKKNAHLRKVFDLVHTGYHILSSSSAAFPSHFTPLPFLSILSLFLHSPSAMLQGVSEEAPGRSSGAHSFVYVHLWRHQALMESNHLSPAARVSAGVSEERGRRNERPKLQNHLADIFQTDLHSSLLIVSE